MKTLRPEFRPSTVALIEPQIANIAGDNENLRDLLICMLNLAFSEGDIFAKLEILEKHI